MHLSLHHNTTADKNPEALYMQRCLQLAANGRISCSPNPMVGALVVHQNTIIGEGWHHKAGEAHAEPRAIGAVKNQELLRESTLYVNLEPCSHFGKTPPCTDLIIEKEIPRVVIACRDPFPGVCGQGIAKLKAAGIEVELDLEAEAARYLNKHFFCYYEKKRPYITLKWAQTADAYSDYIRQPGDGQKPLQISSAYSQLLVHKLRAESDAIMVGSRTALLDNPRLTLRHWPGQHPLRIVMDRKNSLHKDSLLLNDEFPCLIFTEKFSGRNGNKEWLATGNLNSGNMLGDMLAVLHARNIHSLLVEGGSTLQKAFLDAGLWDEIQVETWHNTIGRGHKALHIPEDLQRACSVFSTSLPSENRTITHYLRKH
ncbi:MAG: bifunctional diaminohydroxyphosphoribosylaminopyrimidine deaminase/5-amino-6-(5-phosphoribosylamino)uracil reductase RibD [Bacteroidales bacterium]|nr:bifunctional diaminohydroxyphosphoribosylaminopyrimidine deaminase/5-amino-6-(5-phosphoribosylamino)uracil reductase RibD [Bacteroidales bacterium]MDD3430431.1 bifunctional diaminohydroxyphosphoribosylaminopyrimidine deaminase/5-amino-6-(5-phosphoribosylamino)uracil reductase RibD [Bacteroidales bacterium]